MTDASKDKAKADADAAAAEKKAKADAAAAEKKAKADAAAAEKKVEAGGFVVTCFARSGRRRGGIGWASGDTPVSADDMTDTLRAALEGDPLFKVAEA